MSRAAIDSVTKVDPAVRDSARRTAHPVRAAATFNGSSSLPSEIRHAHAPRPAHLRRRCR
jgi:hypothetical protein